MPGPSPLLPGPFSHECLHYCGVLTPDLPTTGEGPSGRKCIAGTETDSCIPPGYGGLGLSIEGPSKVDINCEDMEDGTCKVTYCPTEPGTYIINIKFADKHVPGEM